MERFIEIISELGFEKDFLPLWRVIEKMEGRHVSSLVDFVNDKIRQNPKDKAFFAQEVCLLYAYWWQKKANSGRGGHNYSGIIRDMGIQISNDSVLRDAVNFELDKEKRLNIPIYQGLTKRWLDSVLCQGGIPLKWIENAENTTCLLRFLKALLHHYENVLDPDWYDTSIAEQMAGHYGLPAYAQNQAYCGYCLSIIQSIIEKETIVSGSKIVQNIINQVAQEHNNHEYQLFGIKWSVMVNPRRESALCYSLDMPRKIEVSEDLQTSSRRYYLNGRFVAEYLRQGNTMYLQPGSRIQSYDVLQNGIEALFLEMTDDNGSPIAVPMFNSVMPVIEEPVCLKYDNADYWTFQARGYADSMAILCPNGWYLDEELPHRRITIQGETYVWIEIDWTTYGKDQIVLRKGEESYTIGKDTINYELYLNFPQYEWIESANRLVVADRTDMSRFVYVRDMDGNLIGKRKWSLSIKNNDSYEDYDPQKQIKSGLNTLRVNMPDGRNKFIRFFYVPNIQYHSIDEKRISFECQGVEYDLIQNQPVEQSSNSTYVCQETSLSVGFQLSSHGTDLLLYVSAPKPSSSFWSIESGTTLSRNSFVSINELHKYKLYQNGREQLRITYRSNIDNLVLANANNSWRSNSFVTLSFISGILQRMLVLYPLTRSRRFELTIGKALINIVTDPYSLNTFVDGNDCKIQVTYNNMIQKSMPLSAIRIDEILNDNFTFVDFSEPDSDGNFSIPEELQNSPFILFSKDPSRRFPAELVDFNEVSMPEEQKIQCRNARKAESISMIRKLLEVDGHKHWGHIWKEFEIVVTYKLPFVTFNSFVAIKDNPTHLAYFMTHLHLIAQQSNFSIDEIVQELERMEYELGFAFHCIPVDCWASVIKDIVKTYEALKVPFLQRMNLPIDLDAEINSSCIFYEKLLSRQFEETAMNALFLRQIHNFEYPVNTNYGRESDYAALISGTFIPGGTRLAMEDYVQPQDLSLTPFEPIWKCRNIETKMRHLAITVPQIAAKNTIQKQDSFWEYNKNTNFTQRLINYIRRYASEVYNDIFIASLEQNR